MLAREMLHGGYRLCWWPAAGWLVLAAAGYVPTRRLGGPDGPAAMIAAQALVLAVIYATMLPALWRMATADGPGRLRLGLKVAAIRFLLTAAIGAVIAWRGVIQPAVFLIWLGITYLVMIKIETLALIHWARKLDKQR
jgi:hypothetical protein